MKKARTPDPAESTQDEFTSGSIRIIPLRSETALSRFPIHRLSKKGSIKIRQTKKNSHGKTVVVWEVRNPPGPLGYKLDTAIINRRIDEHRYKGEIPRLIKLGSLGNICEELGLGLGGRTTDQIKEALIENAAALITARLNYRAIDGTEEYFEFASTRYAIILTGQKLPDGRKADAVYIHFHDLYWPLLNRSQTRPLDYEYLLSLPPAAQRLYELVSFLIFGSLRHQRDCATMPYSELCATAPLTRYRTWEQAKKQLYKLHRPHLDSGYLKSVDFEATTDSNGQPDWIIRYTPGARAKREFREFTKTAAQRREERAAAAPRLLSAAPRSAPAEASPSPDRAGAEDATLIEGLCAVGFSERDARELAAGHPESSRHELDLWPHRDKSAMRNPLGLLRTAITKGDYAPPPDAEKTILTAERKRETEKAAAEQKPRDDHREQLTDAYHDYLRPERERIEREYAEEYKRFADFIAAQRVLKNLSPARREMIELGFFEEFVEERPELGVLTFWQWDAERAASPS